MLDCLRLCQSVITPIQWSKSSVQTVPTIRQSLVTQIFNTGVSIIEISSDCTSTQMLLKITPKCLPFIPTFIPFKRKAYMMTNIFRHQRFAQRFAQRFEHTCPWPHSQRSSPAVRNLHTASNDWMCRHLATRLWVGPLCSTIQPSPLTGWPHRSTTNRWCKLIQSLGS